LPRHWSKRRHSVDVYQRVYYSLGLCLISVWGSGLSDKTRQHYPKQRTRRSGSVGAYVCLSAECLSTLVHLYSVGFASSHGHPNTHTNTHTKHPHYNTDTTTLTLHQNTNTKIPMLTPTPHHINTTHTRHGHPVSLSFRLVACIDAFSIEQITKSVPELLRSLSFFLSRVAPRALFLSL